MSAFPDVPMPSSPYEWKPRFSTVVAGPYASGTSVFRKGMLRPLHSATLKYAYLSEADVQTLYTFFCSRFGRFLPFTFFALNGIDNTPIGVPWTGVYAGVGTSGTTIDLPGKDCTSVTVYENGVTKAGTVLTGGGVDGRDRFTPTVAWTVGSYITASFVGRRAFSNVHFDADEMSFSELEVALTSTGIAMSEAG